MAEEKSVEKSSEPPSPTSLEPVSMDSDTSPPHSLVSPLEPLVIIFNQGMEKFHTFVIFFHLLDIVAFVVYSLGEVKFHYGKIYNI
jgi:hypothetical protein